MTEKPVWTPTAGRIADSGMQAFRVFVENRTKLRFANTAALHAWSVDDIAAFWDAIWDFGRVIGEKGDRRLVDAKHMPKARFFPDATLNYAQNLLRRRGSEDALVFRAEDRARARWSWDRLCTEVSRLQQAMRAAGITRGDCVAALMPNCPEAVAAMLAASSIGATWCSVSPDFGPQGALDRLGQIEPRLLITVDGYWYAGQCICLQEKVVQIASQLRELRHVVVLELVGQVAAITSELEHGVAYADFLDGYAGNEIQYEQLPFDHPLLIVFSSGTTGKPKCIVHRAGGVLLQHLKEHLLHTDIKEGDRIFYFTTLSWMMWNWLVGGLATGATLLLYDGSPFHPKPDVLFDYADAEGMTLFGTSAKFIDSIRKLGLLPIRSHRLEALRSVASTGSPLSADSFQFVHSAIKQDIHLASISGGTDIVSCFVLGDPTQPVYAGEMQGPGLGMAVAVWSNTGRPAETGEKGEMVCTEPFPTMPLKFWMDDGGTRYKQAYFQHFEDVWCQGDFAERTVEGGFIIHGRSDSTLNPGGVRIGTAEIYTLVEQLDEVIESVVIGQQHQGDTRIVLFVRLSPGLVLDDALEDKIRGVIRTGATSRHVPAKIIPVGDVPRTKSGKISEFAVREVVHGRRVSNMDALMNPESLELFTEHPQLAWA